jgi:hypothetical protein
MVADVSLQLKTGTLGRLTQRRFQYTRRLGPHANFPWRAQGMYCLSVRHRRVRPGPTSLPSP